MVVGGVKLTRHQPGRQAAEGGAHLVAARGKPLAGHGDDPAGHAGQAGGNLHVVRHRLEEAAGLLGLVVPGDAEEVHRIHVPQPRMGELGLDLFRDEVGILHLGDGGDDDVVFPRLLDVVLEAFLVDGEIDHDVNSLLLYYLNKNRAYTWRFQSAWRSCRRTW